MNELEEKVAMLEELIQGFLKRMEMVEKEMPEFLKTFLQQYRETLDRISARIETSNKRYDDHKIQQQIDAVTKLVSTMPKVVGVKNHHHFGAWSKSLIIGIVVCFTLTASSMGMALYLNHRNNRLNSEAYNYWLVRALYPEVAKTIERKLKEDPNGFIEQAEKAMAKQKAIIAAQALAGLCGKGAQAAKKDLEKAQSGK